MAALSFPGSFGLTDAAVAQVLVETDGAFVVWLDTQPKVGDAALWCPEFELSDERRGEPETFKPRAGSQLPDGAGAGLWPRALAESRQTSGARR